MKRTHQKSSGIALPAAVLFLTALVSTSVLSQEKPDTSGKIVLPDTVARALETRFHGAVIEKLTREVEDDRVIYDIEFLVDSMKYEADYYEDGSLHNWEKAIAAGDLPAAASATVRKKYPDAAMKEIMAITELRERKEILEGYEIVLEAAGGKKFEITVTADGEILEESEGDE